MTAIAADSKAGCDLASRVITLHRMHVAAPGDPGAVGICESVFGEWLRKHEAERAREPSGMRSARG